MDIVGFREGKRLALTLASEAKMGILGYLTWSSLDLGASTFGWLAQSGLGLDLQGRGEHLGLLGPKWASTLAFETEQAPLATPLKVVSIVPPRSRQAPWASRPNFQSSLGLFLFWLVSLHSFGPHVTIVILVLSLMFYSLELNDSWPKLVKFWKLKIYIFKQVFFLSFSKSPLKI